MTESPNPQETPSRTRRRLLFGALGVSVVALVFGSVWTATARGRWHHSHEDRAAFVEFATERMLSKVDASDAQREQVLAVVRRTTEDLMDVRFVPLVGELGWPQDWRRGS